MRSLRFWIVALCSLCLLLAPAAAPAQAAPALLNPRLSDGANSVSTKRNFYLTPDGSRVVFLARVGTIDRLYSAPTDGSAPPALLSPALGLGETVTQFLLSPDGSRAIFLYGDPKEAVAGQRELYSAPTDGSASAVRLNAPLSALASVQGFDMSPDSSRVVYSADAFSDGAFELFSVPLAGGQPLRLNRPPTPGGSVAGFTITRDSRFVVYRADLDSDEVVELYLSGLTSQGSTRLNAALINGGDVIWFELTPDSATVIYQADQAVDDQTELFRTALLPTVIISDELAGASGGPGKLNGPLPATGDVGAYQLSPDGAAVIYFADAGRDGQFNLYHVATAGGPVRVLNGPLAEGGAIDENFRITPNGAWVIYRADERVAGVYELFAASLDGDVRLRLNAELPEQGDVNGFTLSPDGRHLVYHGTQTTASPTELFSVRLSSDPNAGTELAAPPIKLNLPLTDGGNVSRHYRISPAGDRVIYRADQDTDEVDELYSVPLMGGGATRLNGALVKGGDVDAFRFSADGSRVIYLADQAKDELFSLYAAYAPLPVATLSGPAGPLGVGLVELTVRLSTPSVLSSVQLLLEPADGDAILGQDYSLPDGDERVVVSFAPGETSKTVAVRVLPSLARTTVRTVRLQLADTFAASLGAPHQVTLALAPSQPETPGEQLRVFLPLVLQ